MPSFSLICVSKMEKECQPFLRKMSDWCKDTNSEFVLGVDGNVADIELAYDFSNKVVPVRSLGYLESVLDSVKQECTGDYVFRLDDDEFFSTELSLWLVENIGKFKNRCYNFPRYNLWIDEEHHIFPMYPDAQIRLTDKHNKLRKSKIHGLPPCGYGTRIEKGILHYKFLIKSYEERKRIATIYEGVQTGAGFGDYLIYNLPEDYYAKVGIKVPYRRIDDQADYQL